MPQYYPFINTLIMLIGPDDIFSFQKGYMGEPQHSSYLNNNLIVSTILESCLFPLKFLEIFVCFVVLFVVIILG